MKPILVLVLAGFAVGFLRSPEQGFQLLADWTLITAGLAGVGTLLALAHPLTIAATAIAAPFTTLNPLLGAGFVAAGVELWLRKPNVGDFERLRKDVTSFRGWWTNRAARVLLVFVLSTLGASAGTLGTVMGASASSAGPAAVSLNSVVIASPSGVGVSAPPSRRRRRVGNRGGRTRRP